MSSGPCGEIFAWSPLAGKNGAPSGKRGHGGQRSTGVMAPRARP
jgi:hypothetical protein